MTVKVSNYLYFCGSDVIISETMTDKTIVFRFEVTYGLSIYIFIFKLIIIIQTLVRSPKFSTEEYIKYAFSSESEVKVKVKVKVMHFQTANISQAATKKNYYSNEIRSHILAIT